MWRPKLHTECEMLNWFILWSCVMTSCGFTTALEANWHLLLSFWCPSWQHPAQCGCLCLMLHTQLLIQRPPGMTPGPSSSVWLPVQPFSGMLSYFYLTVPPENTSYHLFLRLNRLPGPTLFWSHFTVFSLNCWVLSSFWDEVTKQQAVAKMQ